MPTQMALGSVGSPARLFVVVGIAALALSACSDSSEFTNPAATSSASTTTMPTTTAPSTTPSVAVAADGSDDPAAAIDELFAEFDLLGGAYRFTSVTMLGDLEALRIEGRRNNGATQLSVSSGGALVHYVLSEDGQVWVRQDGDDSWSEDDSLDSGDPLDQLSEPTAVRLVAETADGNQYSADYEPSAFGLSPDELLNVDVTSRPGQIEFRYELDAVSVFVTISAETDGPTITLPDAEST